MPINALNSYQNRWTIKARVTNKSDIRRCISGRGEAAHWGWEGVLGLMAGVGAVHACLLPRFASPQPGLNPPTHPTGTPTRVARAASSPLTCWTRRAARSGWWAGTTRCRRQGVVACTHCGLLCPSCGFACPGWQAKASEGSCAELPCQVHNPPAAHTAFLPTPWPAAVRPLGAAGAAGQGVPDQQGLTAQQARQLQPGALRGGRKTACSSWVHSATALPQPSYQSVGFLPLLRAHLPGSSPPPPLNPSLPSLPALPAPADAAPV